MREMINVAIISHKNYFGPTYTRNNMLRYILVLMLGIAAAASRCDHFYRKDYTYIDQFDAFYKLHWDQAGLTWGTAFLACDDKGSALFYPKTKDEWTVVKALAASMKAKPNVTEIFVGIHDEFGLGEFMTVDGLSTPSPLPAKDQDMEGKSVCVTMEIETGVYKLESCETDDVKPFVCKKVEEVVPWCPTIDRGYTYKKETKKCYKINQRKKSWTDAMHTCFMEGGVLAVVTSSYEADVVLQMLQDRDEDYFVGFKRLFPNGDFYTVKARDNWLIGSCSEPKIFNLSSTFILRTASDSLFPVNYNLSVYKARVNGYLLGQQFDNTFYKHWRTRNNDEAETGSNCGTVSTRYDYRDLFTGTRNCFSPAAFVCEMVAKS